MTPVLLSSDAQERADGVGIEISRILTDAMRARPELGLLLVFSNRHVQAAIIAEIMTLKGIHREWNVQARLVLPSSRTVTARVVPIG